MMNEQKYAVVSLYHLPGFNSDRSAHIEFTGTKEKCHNQMVVCKRVDRLNGCSLEYEYVVKPVEDAKTFVAETNETKKRNLAIWRNQVYGEPLPA